MLTPLLSEADPKASVEGSIDPLGIYAVADALAVRMIPGVRERQQHPRFLTSIAVSLSLCSEFPADLIAADSSMRSGMAWIKAACIGRRNGRAGNSLATSLGFTVLLL